MIKAVGKLLVLLAVGAGIYAMSQNIGRPPAAAPPFDPEKAYSDGLALEARWNAVKTSRAPLAFPPDPAYLDKVDRQIGEIPQSWPKAEEAVALVNRLRAERPAIEKAYAAAEAKQKLEIAAARERRLYEIRRKAANLLESTFLNGGKDVYVSTEGKELRTLRIRYILMSRPTVYQIQNSDGLIQGWRDVGFRKVILTDGYHDTWTLDLN